LFTNGCQAESLTYFAMTPMSGSTREWARKLLLVWTCSYATLLALLAIAGCSATATPERVPPPPPVTIIVSKRMTVPIIVNPIGTTRALEEVTIRARVRGFLTERHFEYGTNVEKDQLLLVIDEKPFKVALDQVNAQLKAASASLEKAQSSKVVEVAKATLALDQAQLRLDEVEERRERILLARKAASQEDYDKAQAQKLKSAAKVEADSANLAQEVADYKIDIASALADVARAQAYVEDAQINLGYCKMYAPITGRIGELKVKVGNLVGDAGLTELVTIQQLDPMGLDLRPPARYLPEATALLGTGVAVSLTVEGERRHPHVGKAIFIDNKVDEQTSTFLLRAEVANPQGTLLPGEYVKTTMTVGQYVDAVVVPEQAVLEGQEGTRVFVVDAQNKVDVAKVTGVDSYRGLRVLEAGLESGQRVIVEGVQLVRQGQKVDPVPAPLEKFMSEEVAPLPGDLRFNSRVSRVPGRDSRTPQPANEKAAGEKAGPAAAVPKAPIPQSNDPQTKPQPPATRPAGKQPR
jgi:membrane fusion protein, multidrug efflux system